MVNDCAPAIRPPVAIPKCPSAITLPEAQQIHVIGHRELSSNSSISSVSIKCFYRSTSMDDILSIVPRARSLRRDTCMALQYVWLQSSTYDDFDSATSITKGEHVRRTLVRPYVIETI